MPQYSSSNSGFKYELLDRKPGHWIRVFSGEILYNLDGPAHQMESITESQAQDIQDWCEQTQCGTRMSYDMWRFRDKQQLTLFLLRWT